ncbi:MAG: imidazole glycerol phosphate synthase subunit HisH [Methanobacteriota archaeon]
MTVAIIDYGAGNIRSIENAFKTINVETVLASSEKQLTDSSHIVLPGVGAFGDAMENLNGFINPIKDNISSGKPFLGVCLGIQLILEKSEESPGAQGLGLFKGTCKRFPNDEKVPHMGWNTVKKVADTLLLKGINDESFFYFVHSYYSQPTENKIVAGETTYGRKTFPSIISSGKIHATQFHPEKSGEQGLKILKNFIENF